MIIINDGSSDGTADRLKKYDKNPIVKVFSTANRGLGPARNYGVERAVGEYLYFLDSDDKVNPDFIEKVLTKVQDVNYPDIVFFAGETFTDNGFSSDFSPSYVRYIEGIFSLEDFPIRIMQNNKCFYSSACLYVSKKKLWDYNSLRFKNIIHEDEDVIFPLVSYADKIVVLKDVFFSRRIRAGSIMTSPITKKYIDADLIIIASLLDLYEINCFDELAIKRRIRFFVSRYVLRSVNLSLPIQLRLILNIAWRLGDLKVLFICLGRWLFSMIASVCRS